MSVLYGKPVTDDATHVLYLTFPESGAQVADKPGGLLNSFGMWFSAGMVAGFFLGGVVAFAFVAVMLVG